MYTLLLNDGHTLPAIGFGTYKLKGAAGVASVQSAIERGYRLIDSAFNYENEGAVGEAIRRSGVPRAQLHITSKLPGRYHRYEDAISAVQESLYRAGLSYYDFYLIHWPNPQQDLYTEAWQALVDAQKWGLVRSIGVCNFLPEHITILAETSGVLPAVNQIELHPYFNQREQVAWHQSQGIITEAWSPLARGRDMLDSPALANIAQSHGKTPGQVVLRWHVQQGIVPIPKAAGAARQAENISIFDFTLTESEMAAIDALNRPDGRREGLDPTTHEEM